MIQLNETILTTANTFGQLAGYALIIFAIFLGFSLLFNGWPKIGKK